MKKTLEQSVKERVLILDGAMGTMIQRYGLTEADFRGERFVQSPVPLKGNNDLLVLTRPDVVEDIHRKYLAAGADFIETNTFNANRISQADYHTEACVREINYAAARLARGLADEFTTSEHPRYVAGSVGPTNKTLSMSPDVDNPALRSLTFDALSDAYVEQMSALLEGGENLLEVALRDKGLRGRDGRNRGRFLARGGAARGVGARRQQKQAGGKQNQAFHNCPSVKRAYSSATAGISVVPMSSIIILRTVVPAPLGRGTSKLMSIPSSLISTIAFSA